MMYTVYVLHSPVYDKIYIGYTGNLANRLLSHNELSTKGWTVRYRPWDLLHHEEYTSKAEAMKRERELKSAQGRVFIRGLLV
ncbi:GIY-YIG nuclease family protein [Sphingobacterium tabacisoli]|uniref:GIY-YIG nuclease family protein n=1 Tax=Sphingobacterium tabacisoli TaxID=2044855 RepID=UPI001FE55DA6|nr:GIY-YIG nuclease family protein [Sphingobacterium tabacisoli]